MLNKRQTIPKFGVEFVFNLINYADVKSSSAQDRLSMITTGLRLVLDAESKEEKSL